METKGKEYDCISEASNYNEEDGETHGSSKEDHESASEVTPKEIKQFLGI